LTSLYYYPQTGGVETSLRYLAKELKSLRHDVRVLSFDKTDNTNRYEEIDGIPIYRHPVQHSRFPPLTYKRIEAAAFKAINCLLSDFYPDEIWCRNSVVASGLIKCNAVRCIKHIFPTTGSLDIAGLYSLIINHGCLL